eukprot:TRINITY_DN15643_c0_g2_i1.p1 TRINITY_DN15643_c0_g2~~TRINITY_DN15643_c0_g2_i1.p1  ORF type:complete len:259 (+),score=72.71 TRINITY_DN15643_c0_g2_i1:438-1214(+)
MKRGTNMQVDGGSLFGLPSAGPTPGLAKAHRSAAKPVPTESSDDENPSLKTIVAMVGKLALAATFKAETALSAVQDVVILKKNTAITESAGALGDTCREAGKKYHELVMSMKKEERHKAGAPSLRVWEAVITWALAAATEKDCKEVMTAVEAYQQKIKTITGEKDKMEWMSAGVRLCKVSKTYDRETMKLEIITGNGEEGMAARKVWEPILRLLCGAYGGQRKTGRPPASANQRTLVKAMRKANMLADETGNADRHEW